MYVAFDKTIATDAACISLLPVKDRIWRFHCPPMLDRGWVSETRDLRRFYPTHRPSSPPPPPPPAPSLSIHDCRIESIVRHTIRLPTIEKDTIRPCSAFALSVDMVPTTIHRYRTGAALPQCACNRYAPEILSGARTIVSIVNEDWARETKSK